MDANLSVDDIGASQLTGSKQVILYVGPKRKKYTPHKALLCHIVPFFNKLLEENAKTSATSEVYLPELDSAVIELFTVWLYRGADCLSSLNSLTDYVSLHALAGKWRLPKLQNSAIDQIYYGLEGNPTQGMGAISDILKAHPSSTLHGKVERLPGPSDPSFGH
ncbi:hypothetical protein MMC24_007345 [Lignoscripta atroalba]|nr:hypothetical protein [Lignoscripta atroalba]